LEILRFLIENNANIHADNDAALRLAFEKGRFDVMNLLREFGTDSNFHLSKIDANYLEDNHCICHDALGNVEITGLTCGSISIVF
jgi:hypothetical protein